MGEGAPVFEGSLGLEGAPGGLARSSQGGAGRPRPSPAAPLFAEGGARQSLQEVARSVRSGARSARDVVEAAIAAREANDLKAWICFDAEGARAQADRIDRIRAGGADPGPLAGVPASIKDLFGVQGMPIRAGAARELPERFRREGFLVGALRSLGAVILGKTHTVEFAFGGVGLNPHYDTPRNPWDSVHSRVPGGSSSGAGASLLEGSALLAVGSDTGGSIRIPASATGCVGMRTSPGLWPADGVVPLSPGLDVVGFLTRTVEDQRYAFREVERYRLRATAAGPERIPEEGGRSGGEPHVTIGLPSSPMWEEAQPDIVRQAMAALRRLERAGARLAEMDFPELALASANYLSDGVVAAQASEFLSRELPEYRGLLDPIVSGRIAPGEEMRATSYIRALEERRRLARAARARLAESPVDFIAYPTLPLTPPKAADLAGAERYSKANALMLSSTCAASYLGLCAISLPAGRDDAGMPAGLQLAALSGFDHRLLDCCASLERSLRGLP